MVVHPDWIGIGIAVLLFLATWFQGEIKQWWAKTSQARARKEVSAMNDRRVLVGHFGERPGAGTAYMLTELFNALNIGAWGIVIGSVFFNVPADGIAGEYLRTCAFAVEGIFLGRFSVHIKSGLSMAEDLRVPAAAVKRIDAEIKALRDASNLSEGE